jgi:hypothetical protein
MCRISHLTKEDCVIVKRMILTATVGVTLGVLAVAAPASAAVSPRNETVCTYKLTALANVRRTASTSGAIVGTDAKGSELISAPETVSGAWTHGSDNGVTGWVQSKFLTGQSCKILT